MQGKQLVSYGAVGLVAVVLGTLARIYVGIATASRIREDFSVSPLGSDTELVIRALGFILTIVGAIVSCMGIAKPNGGREAGIAGIVLAGISFLPSLIAMLRILSR